MRVGELLRAVGEALEPLAADGHGRRHVYVPDDAGRRLRALTAARPREVGILAFVVTPGLLDGGKVWRRPSPRLLVLRRLQVAAVTVAVALAAVVLGVYVGVVAGLACGGAVVVFAFAAGRFVRGRFYAWGNAEREDDVLARRWVSSLASVVPYGRMQFIDVTADPLGDRSGLQRCACTRLQPQAIRASRAGREEAARLRYRLAELGEAQAAGL
jgi:membrane protein YdbS with pleckstrin-like domain